jgi:hypothetical protein
MTAATGTTWRLGLTQYSILACGALLARTVQHSPEQLEQNANSSAVIAGKDSGSVGFLTLPCFQASSDPCRIVRCCGCLGPFIPGEEIVSPANRRASWRARKRCYNLGHSYLFLPRLKRFYAGFYCSKAVDSD